MGGMVGREPSAPKRDAFGGVSPLKRTGTFLASPSGTVQVSFKAWQTPTLGQRSRDPAQAADGLIWWAGQFGTLIGSINPATGEMKEDPLPAKADAAHRRDRCQGQ